VVGTIVCASGGAACELAEARGIAGRGSSGVGPHQVWFGRGHRGFVLESGLRGLLYAARAFQRAGFLPENWHTRGGGCVSYHFSGGNRCSYPLWGPNSMWRTSGLGGRPLRISDISPPSPGRTQASGSIWVCWAPLVSDPWIICCSGWCCAHLGRLSPSSKPRLILEASNTTEAVGCFSLGSPVPDSLWGSF
jgi:hypothetical protein